MVPCGLKLWICSLVSSFDWFSDITLKVQDTNTGIFSLCSSWWPDSFLHHKLLNNNNNNIQSWTHLRSLQSWCPFISQARKFEAFLLEICLVDRNVIAGPQLYLWDSLYLRVFSDHLLKVEIRGRPLRHSPEWKVWHFSGHETQDRVLC